LSFNTFKRIPTFPVFALLAGFLGFVSPEPASATLSYYLSSPIVSCDPSADPDGDCLRNDLEQQLALAAAPLYFRDEDEGCDGQVSFHYKRQDYFQVRPTGSGVRHWTPGTTQRRLQVTYFFLYPHDCLTLGLFWGGHQGDSENIRLHFYSTDLQTWHLDYAYYWHHGRQDYVSGAFLEARARDLGVAKISVAADEDSHGSWPGKLVSEDDCADTMDDFCHGTCDCFTNDSWRTDKQTWNWQEVMAHRNVGGPSPERYLAPHVTVSGLQAWTDLDVGHGLNREFWSGSSMEFGKFCGWQCPSWARQSNGDCSEEIHGEHECAGGPLYSKVDTSFFMHEWPNDPPPGGGGDDPGDGGGGGGGCVARCKDGKEAEPVQLDPERAARARRLTREAQERLRFEAGPAKAQLGNHEEWLAQRAADPVAALVPMLAGTSKERQLETLKWALSFPDRTFLASLFEDLSDVTPGKKGRVAAGEAAYDRVLDLIALLESEGVRAKAPEEGKAAFGFSEARETGSGPVKK